MRGFSAFVSHGVQVSLSNEIMGVLLVGDGICRLTLWRVNYIKVGNIFKCGVILMCLVFVIIEQAFFLCQDI